MLYKFHKNVRRGLKFCGKYCILIKNRISVCISNILKKDTESTYIFNSTINHNM